jgi:Lipopolysaccharide-assembly
VVAAALLAGGCGYHFAASGSSLPQSAHTIYVARFGNKSRFTGVNDEFMRYLKDEIADHKRLRLVDSPDDADLELSGQVTNVLAAPASFNSVNEPITYEETMTISATLIDRHTGKVIWSTAAISSNQQFAPVAQTVVTTSPTFLQQNLRSQDIAQMLDVQVAATQQAASRQQMMTRLASDLYASMSEGF